MRIERLPRESRRSLRDFQAFHAALTALRARAENGAAAGDEAGSGALARDAFAELSRRLGQLGARRQAEDTGWEQVDSAYVLASYADEAMIHLTRWGGATIWASTLLERSLYGSRIAGERVFEAASAILARRDAGRRDLAMTIFLALSCGFRGSWRGADDGGEIERLRRGLFELATDHEPPAGPDMAAAFAQAQAHTDTDPAPRLPRDVERWKLAVVGLLLGYLVLSHATWLWTFGPVALRATSINALGP